MSYLAHLLSDASRHWVLTGLGLVVFGMAVALLRARLRRRRVIRAGVAESLNQPSNYIQALRRAGIKKTGLGTALVPVALVGFMLFVFFGEWLTNPLIYHNGESGEGVVTGEYSTASTYNNERVIGFNVVIRKADGDVVRTSFRSNSFNVYPSANEVRYPQAGVRFNVRYLPVHPDDFVIITNDGSPYARSLRCRDLLQELAAAGQASNFAPGDAALAQARDNALAAARAGGCVPGMN